MTDTRLYYLGGLPENAVVTAAGRAFALPRPGDYLTMPVFLADAVIRRYQAGDQNAFTKNFNEAAAVRREQQEKEETVKIIEILPENLTKEQLEALLQRFNGSDPEDKE